MGKQEQIVNELWWKDNLLLDGVIFSSSRTRHKLSLGCSSIEYQTCSSDDHITLSMWPVECSYHSRFPIVLALILGTPIAFQASSSLLDEWIPLWHTNLCDLLLVVLLI